MSSSSSGSSSLINNTRPQTPPIGQRTSSKTKVTSGSKRGTDRQITHLVPKHSPLHASPNYPSPGHLKSPKRDKEINVINESHNPNSLASLPMIGIDDYSDVPNPPAPILVEKSPNINILSDVENGVEEMSDTSSSSSSSDSDSDVGNSTVIYNKKGSSSTTNGHMNGSSNSSTKLPSIQTTHILNEDLRLSESGSDSE